MRLGPFGRRAEPEDEGWEAEAWAALEEQGDSVAAGFSWIEDETFCWVAVGELLTALGVLPETIRPLGQLRPLLDEVRTLEGGGDPDGELIPLAPERVQDMVDRAVPIVVPLLREVLESLSRPAHPHGARGPGCRGAQAVARSARGVLSRRGLAHDGR